MLQPNKIKNSNNQKTKIIKKSNNIQPLPPLLNLILNRKIVISKESELKREKDIVTTSKLEYFFAENFLTKFGINFIHQWFCFETKRIYDFAILTPYGSKTQIDALIEIHGTYFHADPRFYDRKNLIYDNQKKQIIIDEQKKEWAYMNNIPLITIWEYDINNNPKKILEELKKRFYTKKI
jgi:hypothetical protein